MGLRILSQPGRRRNLDSPPQKRTAPEGAVWLELKQKHYEQSVLVQQLDMVRPARPSQSWLKENGRRFEF